MQGPGIYCTSASRFRVVLRLRWRPQSEHNYRCRHGHAARWRDTDPGPRFRRMPTPDTCCTIAN